MKLVVNGQTDRPTDGQTDMTTYRAAIAAKNHHHKIKLHYLNVFDHFVFCPKVALR